uniref:type II toxin-antitoxin system VapB family antitoxin n=1 Tax=uncultured Caulobacter sp. TaxID=158749 RepID=UPI0025EF96C2|nr:type II toxin-antitoxin system VapB family antitoxin [uncultured Caulobacter sp.]
MAFHVRDPETDALVRELAEKTKLGITEAVKMAAAEALRARDQARAERLAKMRAICAEVASWPRTGLKADKAFFDEMYED